MPLVCSYKPMPSKDYGELVTNFRTSRGLIRSQVAEVARISISTIQNIESSTDAISVRASNLDGYLMALATRGPLTADEIKILCDATGRRWESFEAINREVVAGISGPELSAQPDRANLTAEDRLLRAYRILVAAGQGELALSQLEIMAAHFSHELRDANTEPPSTRRQRLEDDE